jgi:hypothetical protein
MRQNFELKNCGAIVPQKTVPRSSTLWKDSRLPERGEKENKTGRKRRENKREGRVQRCSDGRPPRVHERAATTAKRRRFQIFLFTQGKVGGWGGGLWDAVVKFTLHYKSRSSLNPNRAILLVQALKIVLRALHYNYNIFNLWLPGLRVPRAKKDTIVPW